MHRQICWAAGAGEMPQSYRQLETQAAILLTEDQFAK